MTKRFFNEKSKNHDSLTSLLSGLKKDDLILLGIILILLGDGCNDKELLIILGFLFVSDKINIREKLCSND